MPRVTIAQVAAEAGVSIATASKALKGTDRISSDTIRRVTEAAVQLGYRPNRAAQLLAGKNKHIGILIPTSPEPIHNLFAQGSMEAMAEYEDFGFHYTIIRHDFFGDMEAFASGLDALEGKVQGLIYIGDVRIRHFAERLHSFNVPMVVLQTVLSSLDVSNIINDPPCVMVDAPCVGRMAAQYLSLTCKKVALIVGDANQFIHQKNIEGFCEEAARRSLDVSGVFESFDDMVTARILTEKLIDHNLPDGIFVSSYVAPAVCAVLREQGLTGRISVVGVDIWDQSVRCLRDGSLSAIIYQNQPLQARRAVEMLTSMMRKGGREKTDNIYIKPELVMESCLAHYYKN